MRRRRLLRLAGVAAAAGAAAVVGARGGYGGAPAVAQTVPLAGSPFRFGVASSPLGNVLWTRLAVDPLAPDGRGGMPATDIPVGWKVARHPDQSEIVAAGVALARAGDAHSVHHEVTGLPADTELFYWFEQGGYSSPVGRLRTAPLPGQSPAQGFTVAMVSCANLEHGYFHCYDHIASHQVDLILALGDFIYADTGGLRGDRQPARSHLPAVGECFTLAEYRLRHSQYRLDPQEQAMRASAGMVVSFDDHDLDNDWAGSVPETDFSAGTPTVTFWDRREHALRAFWENLPLPNDMRPRLSYMPNTFRNLRWGNLADLHLLDTRQFRSKRSRNRRDDPHRYMLGPAQMTALGASYRGARWDLIANQVTFAPWSVVGIDLNMDQWDGYSRDRRRVMDQWIERGVRNPVVLTGDVHMAGANLIPRNLQTVACEIVASSISAGGDGPGDWDGADRGLAVLGLLSLDEVEMVGRRRGWVKLSAQPDNLLIEWRGTPVVSKPTAQPDLLFASARIPDGTRAFHDKWNLDDVDFSW